MVTVATVLLMLCAQTEPAAARKHGHSLWGDLFGETRPKLRETRPKPRRQAALKALPASVPLPQPRPADAPAEQPASPPPPSACRLALTDAIAIAPSIPDIKGPGDCGGEDLVRLEAVVLPDKRRVSLKPAATFRCPMATAVADWIRTDMTQLAASLGSVI
ncbi:MAG TPA: extensin family protein, partial [Bradyrhizobium sp.]|nr:extensin family protein [Bradyrhizobium sp.]